MVTFTAADVAALAELIRSLDRAEARMAKVRDVHVLTPHPIRSRVNCSTCGAVDGPTCPTLTILDGAS